MAATTTRAPVGSLVYGATAPVGRLERLPGWLARVPIVAQWLWLSMRYGSITLPSCANPKITSGGLTGEGKLEYLGIMGERALAASATTVWLPCGGPESADEAEAAMARGGMSYPVILKPDVGCGGCGVRRVDRRAQLVDYLGRFPRGERILIQRYLPGDGEASVFYMRLPSQPRGRLTGLLLRHPPRVVGDGLSSVGELMAANDRLRRLGRDGASEPGCDPSRVPALGEAVRVAAAGSARIGTVYEEAGDLITPALTQAIDSLARDMDDFHVGRFDVKFESLAALREGRGFSVIEVNGAGCDAVRASDPALTLREVYRTAFASQRRLFAIGDAMRRRGHRPIGPWMLARLHLGRQELMSHYPRSN